MTKKKIDEYAARAKEQWGNSPEYQEFEEKSKNRTKESEQVIAEELMQMFVEFGEMKDKAPETPAVQQQVKRLQDYITQHFYTCSNEVLFSLGQMYTGGGEFTKNIDSAGGAGTAAFTAEAIRIYCEK